jgi:hypothetical protein
VPVADGRRLAHALASCASLGRRATLHAFVMSGAWVSMVRELSA